MMTNDKKKGYEVRFRLFLNGIATVNRMKPKEKYLYRLMDGVPFKDLETAIMMAKIDYGQKMDETVNDNKA